MVSRTWESLMPCPVVAWDLETTGPDPLQHEILEMAAVSCTGAFSTLVRPRRGEITPGAQGIHGIGEKHVRGAPSFPDALDGLIAFLEKQTHSSSLSAGRPAHIVLGGRSRSRPRTDAFRDASTRFPCDINMNSRALKTGVSWKARRCNAVF